MGGGFYSRNGGNHPVIVGGRYDIIDIGVSDPYLFRFNSEILNEAGAGNIRRTTGFVSFTADDPVTEIFWRPMSFPTAGYTVVAAAAQISVNHTYGTGL
jgi:hypothetical protein